MSSDMRHAGTDTKRLFGDPVNNSVNTLSIKFFFSLTRETMCRYPRQANANWKVTKGRAVGNLGFPCGSLSTYDRTPSQLVDAILVLS
jgi:hypothetical protein